MPNQSIAQLCLFAGQTHSKREAQAAHISEVLDQLRRQCDLFTFELDRFGSVIRRRSRRSHETDDDQILAALREGKATVKEISQRTLIPTNTVYARLQSLIQRKLLDEGRRTIPYAERGHRKGGAPFDLVYAVGRGRRVRRRKSLNSERTPALLPLVTT
jgi:hypothetical protein